MGTSSLSPHRLILVLWVAVIRLVKDRIRDHHCATNEAVKEAACVLKWSSTAKGSFGFSKDGRGLDFVLK